MICWITIQTKHEKLMSYSNLSNTLKAICNRVIIHIIYYKEESDLYFMRLGDAVNMMLEIELPLLRQIEVAYVAKIKQLLATIAKAVPFVPNVSKLSERIGINRSITILSTLFG